MPRRKKPDLSVKYFSPRLWEQLAGLLAAPISWVQAPSGYGKTTAVHALLAKHVPRQRLFWFTILEDEDLAVGWQRFCRLLLKADHDAATRLLELGPPAPETVGKIAETLRRMHSADACYIVLDDFQHWAERFPKGFVELWLQPPGAGLHHVLITQPLAAGAGPRPDHPVLVLGQASFALTEAEIVAYFQKAGLPIPQQTAAAIGQTTEGWMAAVYLQLLQMAEGGGHAALSGDVLRLMRAFVWSRLAEPVQRLLLMLSPFQAFTLPQVLDILGAETLPEDMRQALLCRGFVRYDARQKRYDFHAILLELLRGIFAEQSDGFRQKAYAAAGRWSEKTGNKLMAVACYHKAGDYRSLFAVTPTDVELHTAGELCSVEMIEDILAHCPEDVKRDHPLTLLAFCYELFSAGRYEGYVQLCEAVAQMIPTLPIDAAERNRLLGELALMQSFAEYNDIEKMSGWHQKAHALIQGRSRLVDNTVPWTMGCPSVLYMYHRGAGRLAEELGHMATCLPFYTQLAHGHGSGGAQTMAAEALVYQGQVQQAEAQRVQGAYLAKRFGQHSLLLCTAFLGARMAVLNGDEAAFAATVEELEAGQATAAPSLVYAADMALGHLWCVLGRPDKTAPWLAAGDFAEGQLPLPAVPYAQMVHLQYCLATKNYARLYGLAELFIAAAREAHNLLPQIHILLLLAAACYREGRQEAAMEHLLRALELALPDGLILPFAEYGDDLLPLMGTLRRAVTPEVLEAVRGMAARIHGAGQWHRPDDGGAPPHALTAREYEVALLAASRRSNQEIAQATGISVATVRTHLQAVYGKLGIDSHLKSKRNLLEDKLKK